jgi:hypothetical protein
MKLTLRSPDYDVSDLDLITGLKIGQLRLLHVACVGGEVAVSTPWLRPREVKLRCMVCGETRALSKTELTVGLRQLLLRGPDFGTEEHHNELWESNRLAPQLRRNRRVMTFDAAEIEWESG